MTELSPKALESLANAGWTQDWSLDTQHIESEFKRLGHWLSPMVKRFFRQFAGLKLRYPHFRDPTGMDGCEFLAHKDLATLCPASVWRYAEPLASRLTEIGRAFSGHIMLMMADNGCVFGAFENMIWRIGEDPHDAINTLCDGREIESVSYQESAAGYGRDRYFTEQTRLRLLAAGWVPGRSESVHELDLRLATRGFRLPWTATTFLAEFSGLTIRYPRFGDPTSEESCSFDPLRAADLLTAPDFEMLHVSGRQSLAPIGTAGRDGSVLLMDERGWIYTADLQTAGRLLLVGVDTFSALNALCGQRPLMDARIV